MEPLGIMYLAHLVLEERLFLVEPVQFIISSSVRHLALASLEWPNAAATAS